MDTALRLQVRVFAREAQTQLKLLEAQMRRLNTAGAAGSHKSATNQIKQQAMQASAAAKLNYQQQVASAKLASTQQIQASKASAQTQINNSKAQVAAIKANYQKQTSAAKASYAAQVAASKAATRSMSTGVGMIGRMNMALDGLLKRGKNLQWIGRQINFNFTLPLVVAAAAATKWELENEKAFTRLAKVYGDSGRDYTKVLDKIRNGLRYLSDIYGVQQSEVIELGANWAAAGVQGAALAKTVETSARLAILGDYQNLADTFSDLITIQQAYKFSAEQLSTAISLLNTVENNTAATLPDLVTGVAKAGAAADMAGVPIRNLAAFMAVLTPATGSASTAGNALKTIFSRMADPTKEMVDLMESMGINMDKFNTEAGHIQLEDLAKKFDRLTDSQQRHAASVLAGRFQVNRFAAIMDDLNSKASTYRKVMDMINPKFDAKNWRAANTEINKLLTSDPKALEILVTQMRNLLTEAVAPLIPSFINLVALVRDAVRWFANLDPKVQGIIVAVAGLTIATGILSQLIGSIMLLFGQFAKGILWIVAAVPKLIAGLYGLGGAIFDYVLVPLGSLAGSIGSLLVSPWVLAIAAILASIWVFHEEAYKAFQGVVTLIQRAFNALPQSIHDTFQSVINIIARAIDVIWQMLSYLNPFARHSPSLVDNVKAGVRVIANEYGKLAVFGSVYRKAANDLRDFAAATRSAQQASEGQERRQTRRSIVAVSPSAGPALSTLYQDLDKLQPKLDILSGKIASQQSVVDRWAGKLERASSAVDAIQRELDPLAKKLQGTSDRLNEAQTRLQDWATAPIKGMRAFEERTFRNEMAQKRLRLEILKLSNTGQTFDDIQNKIAGISGAIEDARATMADLRLRGAGSDVLGVYEDQIGALEKQRTGLEKSGSNIDALEKQLERLQRQAEIMDLQKALKFDPLTHQIERAANATKEFSFSKIMNGLTREQANVDRLTDSYDSQKTVVDAIQKSLDKATARRDRIQVSYDAESKLLDHLQNKYGKLSDRISAITDAIEGAARASQKLIDALNKGDVKAPKEPKAPAADENPLGPAGDFKPNKLLAQMKSKLNLDKLIRGWRKQAENLFNTNDLFKTFRDKWEQFKKWWAAVSKRFQGIKRFFTHLFDNISINFENIRKSIRRGLKTARDTVARWAGNIGKAISDAFTKVPYSDQIKDAFSFLVDRLPGYFREAWHAVQEFTGDVGREFNKFAELAKPAIEFFDHFVHIAERIFNYVLKPLFKVGMAVIVAIFTTEWEVIKRIVRPVFDFITRTITNALEVIRLVIKFFLDLFNGDWGKAWRDLAGIVDVVWEEVKGLVKDAVGVITGILSGLWAAFKRIGGHLLGGFLKGIADKALEVIKWFGELPGRIFKLIKRLFGIQSPSTKMAHIGRMLIQGLINGVKELFGKVLDWFRNLKDRVIAILNRLKNAALAVWRQWRDGVHNIMKRIGEIVSNAIGWVRDKIKAVLNVIKSIWNNAWDVVKNKVIGIWDKIKKIASDAIGWVRDKIKSITDRIKTIWRDAWDAVKSKISTIKGVIQTIVSGFVDRIKEIWKGLKSIVSWFKDHIYDPVKSKFDDLASDIQTAFQTGVDGVKRIWNGLKTAVKDPINIVIGFYNKGIAGLWNFIATKVGLPQLPTIEKLNSGGRVPGTGSADTVPAMLTPGEFVVNKKAASKWGPKVLKQLNNPWGTIDPAVFHYAAGGAVRQPDEALAWAKQQAGKPYRFPMVGPDSYDCSGFTSALINYILGYAFPYFRRHSSGTVGSDPALRPGAGSPNLGLTLGARPPYTMNSQGFSVGHVAATLAGVNMEATPPAVRVGGYARGWNNSTFTQHYFMPGYGEMTPVQKQMFGGMKDLLSMKLPSLGDSGFANMLTKLFTGLPRTIFDFLAYKMPKIIFDGLKKLIPGLSTGGIVTKPTLSFLAESSREAVIPLDNTARALRLMDAAGLTRLALANRGTTVTPTGHTRTTTININGDLSFPNITDPADAERFISNLEVLAGT